jgi:hypothetical protein
LTVNGFPAVSLGGRSARVDLSFQIRLLAFQLPVVFEAREIERIAECGRDRASRLALVNDGRAAVQKLDRDVI